MAKEKESKEKVEKLEEYLSPAAALAASKEFQGLHLSNQEDINWTCPTGSLGLDLFLGGGFRPGVWRMSGAFEAGKTAFTLNLARLFQIHVPNSFVVYNNAEGRLTPERLKQSGISTDPKHWFRLDCNIADAVYEFYRKLIENNDKKLRYMLITDSVDALQRQSDREKRFEESEKVAGGALINSAMGKKLTLPLTKFGHCAFQISQVRVDLNSGTSYSGPKDKPSGGKALGHYASLFCEFKDKYNDDYIWENDKAKSAKERGKPIGHFCTMKFIKTRNDRTMESVRFPIKRGRQDGNSIWVEYEFFMLAIQWGLIKTKGPWLAFSSEFCKEMSDAKIEFKEQIQGERAFIEYLEQHPEIVTFGCDKFKKLLINAS